MQTLNNMKNRKGILSKGILLLSFIATGFVSQSQSLQETIRMAENQRYEKAKESFRRLVQLEPKNGNIYYYFGETYFNQDTALIDSADLAYKKGSEAEPFNPLNFVGLGKVLWFKNYQNGAEALFTQALEMTKYKNATVMMKIAENYINAKNKNLPKANELLNKALKLEPKNPEIHLLLGDAMLEANPQDGSGPVKKYSEAIELDKSSAKAILRIGKLYYRAKNPTEALKWYKEAIKIDSTFAPVYIEMGELYLMAGLNKQSLEQYKKYLALNNDLEARTRLAQILWVNKFFEEAIREVTNIHQTDSSSIYLYRILGYSYSEVGDKFPPDGYKKGLVAINKFFDMAATKKGFKLLASDFSAKGKLLSKTGQDSLAMIELKKALELDSTVTDLYSDIAFAYYKSKKYNDALTYYLKKIAAGKPTVNDYVYLGLSYYQTKQFALADSAFKKVISVSPDLILAHKWRAKSNSQLDPDSKLALAKPHFEKVVELILAKPEALEKNKKDLIEAYEYLISYHLLIMKDATTATTYIEKIKEIDPTNKRMEAFGKVVEDLKKKN
jgi:tetratricopeptide (TPR) repeat protein